MVALRVSEFLAADALDGSEIVGLVQGTENRQSTTADIAALSVGSVANMELIRDTIASALLAGANVTITVDDPGNTIEIAVTTETIQDIVGALIAAATGSNSGVVVTYDDAGNALTIGLLSSAFQTLTDQATIAWNMADGFNAKVTLGGNRAIGTPTNPVEGRTYTLQLIQDGSGSRTITDWGVIDFGSVGAPTLSTGAGKKDFVYLQCIETSGPTFRASFSKAA
jgi:hypothetical protein